jgi:hypothetical protein
MRFISLIWLVWAVTFTGCIGPVALHEPVLGYDESINQLDREMLLLKTARKHNNLTLSYVFFWSCRCWPRSVVQPGGGYVGNCEL